MQTLAFTVHMLPPEEHALKLSRGVVAAAVQQYQSGIGRPLITASTPGTALTDAVLLVDGNHEALQRPAALEFGWGGDDLISQFPGFTCMQCQPACSEAVV